MHTLSKADKGTAKNSDRLVVDVAWWAECGCGVDLLGESACLECVLPIGDLGDEGRIFRCVVDDAFDLPEGGVLATVV